MSQRENLRLLTTAALFTAAVTVMTAFLPQFLRTLVQGIGSGALFLVIAPALDGVKLKEHMKV